MIRCKRLFRWIVLGALLLSLATNIWISSSKSIFPDDTSFQWAFLPLIAVNGTVDTTHNSSVFSLTASSGSVYFGGRQLLLSNESHISSVHCLSETFNETRTLTPGALYRSCRYYNMCYHVKEKRLVLFPSVQHWKLLSRLHQNIYLATVSKAVMTSAVMQTAPDQTPAANPLYLNHSSDNRYYYVMNNDEDIVWIPIEPVSCESVLWDVYLPVYTLVEMFDFQDKLWRLLLLPGTKCTREQLEEYSDMMGLSARDIMSASDGFVSLSNEDGYNQFICLRRSVMGMGAYGDHQVIRSTQHLKEPELKKIPPNHIRRETNLRGFRERCLVNLNLTPRRAKPYIVAYSDSVSADLLALSVPGIQLIKLSPVEPWRQQIGVTSKAAILVLASNEDKTAAMFLPEGATLILVGKAQEDWDLWSNNALLRLHLVTRRVKDAVENLILDELSRLKEQSSAFTMTGDDNRVDFANNRTVTLVHANPPITRVHCVGEKMFPNLLGADRYRSCHFENLCFDLKNKNFVMFPSPLNQNLVRSNGSSLDEENYFSSIPRSMVASPQPSKLGRGYFVDIPRVHNRSNVSSYYRLEGAWLSIKTFNTKNLGTLYKSVLP
jgi:hypothetical protein